MATKKPDRKPLGRPRLDAARHVTFCVRLTNDELEILADGARALDKVLRVWARDVLLRAAKRAAG